MNNNETSTNSATSTNTSTDTGSTMENSKHAEAQKAISEMIMLLMEYEHEFGNLTLDIKEEAFGLTAEISFNKQFAIQKIGEALLNQKSPINNYLDFAEGSVSSALEKKVDKIERIIMPNGKASLKFPYAIVEKFSYKAFSEALNYFISEAEKK